MNPDVKHNLVNWAIIASPLIVTTVTYVLSGQPIERNPNLAFAFLMGSILSSMVASFVTVERKWK